MSKSSECRLHADLKILTLVKKQKKKKKKENVIWNTILSRFKLESTFSFVYDCVKIAILRYIEVVNIAIKTTFTIQVVVTVNRPSV